VVVTNGANVVTASADRGIITENIGASVSFTASGTKVDTSLLLSSLTGGNTYELAYEFINETKGKLIASAAESYTAAGTSGEVLKTLTLNAADAVADDAAYRLNVTVTRGLSTAAATAVRAAKEKEQDAAGTNYTVSVTSGEGGHTFPTSGPLVVGKGDSLIISFYPDEGYTVKDVKIDGVSLGSLENYTFWRIKGDHKVEVEFMAPVSPPKTGSASAIGFSLLALLGSAICLFVIRKKKELN
jgi:LPXTG-motif cell wall-anchored protein